MAFVLVFLAFILYLKLADQISNDDFFAVAGASSVIALVGLLDDHGHIAALWRLVVHFLGAIWALFWVGGMPPLLIGGGYVDLGFFGQCLCLLYLVWLLNLYNFMDGIDGIASVEAICVCVGGAILYLLIGAEGIMPMLPMVLAAAVTGFLVWNFPPARIFMGDAGSGFLGIVIGIFSLQAAWYAPELLWSWLILLGVFVVDATCTLLRRVLRGEKPYEAHRSHAYQRASRRYGSHLSVTLSVVLLNVCWLFPISLWVGVGELEGMVGLSIAYLPLVVLAVKFGAGAPEQSPGQ